MSFWLLYTVARRWLNESPGWLCVWRSFRANPPPDCGPLKLIDYTSDTRYNHIKIRLSHLVNPHHRKTEEKKIAKHTNADVQTPLRYHNGPQALTRFYCPSVTKRDERITQHSTGGCAWGSATSRRQLRSLDLCDMTFQVTTRAL